MLLERQGSISEVYKDVPNNGIAGPQTQKAVEAKASWNVEATIDVYLRVGRVFLFMPKKVRVSQYRASLLHEKWNKNTSMNDEENGASEISDSELDALADAGEKTLHFERLASLSSEEMAVWPYLTSDIDKIARLRIDHQIRDVAEVGAEIGITDFTQLLILWTVLKFNPNETLTADEATLWGGYF